MISSLAYKSLEFTIKLSYWSSSTPYLWDEASNRIVVSQKKVDILRWKLSLWLSYLSVIVIIPSYMIYLSNYGFHVNDKHNIFQFIAACCVPLSLAPQRCFQYNLNQLCSTSNQVFDFFDGANGKLPTE